MPRAVHPRLHLVPMLITHRECKLLLLSPRGPATPRILGPESPGDGERTLLRLSSCLWLVRHAEAAVCASALVCPGCVSVLAGPRPAPHPWGRGRLAAEALGLCSAGLPWAQPGPAVSIGGRSGLALVVAGS